MAEFEYDEDFECEEIEEELVEELLNLEIYGEQTTLDGILEAAEKSLNETKARVTKLKTSFGGEQNTGENDLVFVPESSTILLDSSEVNIEDVNLPENKDATSVNDSYAMTATIKELLKETTLEESHHDDTGGERKSHAPSNTDTPTTFVHGGNEATLDVSLPTLEKSHHDTGGECKPDTPTTLVHGGNKATLDVSVPTLEESLHDDTGGEHKPDAPSNTDTPTTLVHGGNDATLDVSLPTLQASDHDEVEIVLDGGEIKSSESSDVEVWKDGCPLPSSGPTCSEWQNSADAHSSGAEAISTQVSTAGCLPECEEPRSGCVNIESVMSSEQVIHLPTSINKDGPNAVGKEGFQNKVEDDEIGVTDSSLKNEDEQESDKCKSKNKKKKGKNVHKKEKRLKDENAEKTKTKKFHRRLISLFCCCFKSQERNDQKNERELGRSQFVEHNSF